VITLLVALAATPPLQLMPDPPPARIEAQLQVLHDDALALSFDDARASTSWSDGPRVTPKPAGVIFARATVENASPWPIGAWLVSEDETLWRFSARVDDGPVRSSGRALPGGERSVEARKPTLALTFPPGKSELLVRLEARTSPAAVALTLGAPAHMSAELNRESVILGGMYGALLIMAFYSLFLAALVRERVHGLYAAYVFAVVAWLAFTDGSLHYLGWTGDLASAQRVFVIVSHAVTLLVIGFGRAVLETGALRRSDRALRVAGGAVIALGAWGLIAPGFTQLALYSLVSLAAVALIIACAARRWRAGYSPAAYYLAGWLLLFATLTPLAVLQLEGTGGLPIWAWPLGFVLEVGFAAAAIAERSRLDHVRVKALNRAGTRFVPFEFLKLLGRTDLTEVEKGDNVAQEMSILFSDIRSFTTIVEGRTPAQNFRFINDYLGWMEPPIKENGGFIDSYEGDAIMALFAGDADDAVRAGVGDLRALQRYNAEREARGEPRLRIGVGVNSGGLMLGTIGGRERIKCGVIGDPVNLAARVEGMTKKYGAGLLITSDTFDRLKDPGAFDLRELDTVIAKGKSAPVTLFEVLDGLDDDEREAKLASRDDYAAALAAWRAGDLDAARAAWSRCDDDAARLMLARVDELRARGLPEDWDGTWTLSSK
jgi:class 3 adenylate cyclase